MQPELAQTEALIQGIAAARNHVIEGWMPLAQGFQQPGTPQLFPQLAPNAAKFAAQQAAYLEQQARLWSALLEGKPEALAKPDAGDRRFSGREWSENRYYNYLRQSYLLAARFLNDLVESTELEPVAKDRLRFAARQWIDAMSPANFAATNPQAIRKALESRGESLARGMANLLTDARKGRISQSDESAFEVGRNLATTPGAVVYENDLMQLIQYAPSTPQVGVQPLVMVPPCINKYYILDLQPENSFVRYAVSEGHTVFMVSWRNVGEEQGGYGWDDYLRLGIFEPLQVARAITGADRVNALGFCVGGTLLAAALAVLAERGDAKVASATYLTTMLDFAESGQIGVFIDPQSVAAREAAIGNGGILPGTDLAFVFSALRANDLVWPYVVNNYLMGESPAAFDLLYWNADSTNLPGPMYCTYVRNTYLENRLRMPGALTNCDVAVDLGKVAQPAFILATREDHIVPWRSAYRSLGLLGGQKKFVLGASGHVAGVVNPAAKGKRSYWTGEPYPENPEAWLEQAKEQPGSWWTEWTNWLEQFNGGTRAAPPAVGSTQYPPLEPAPGRYVKQRAN
ncbi:MAG TPA: class I poly(R)-hydroxyalkanoic acid synthase [Burkholderiales bacterium]|jgi:polyhydroxyalkanoate synthase|nr:class I poly(R)-hydroxyalkanoic acid synthase [Burkholderiales bacterium]